MVAFYISGCLVPRDSLVSTDTFGAKPVPMDFTARVTSEGETYPFIAPCISDYLVSDRDSESLIQPASLEDSESLIQSAPSESTSDPDRVSPVSIDTFGAQQAQREAGNLHKLTKSLSC